MSENYRELALFEAFRLHWIATGCPSVLPNGVYLTKARIGTRMPYAVVALVSNVHAGYTNKSTRRDVVIQVQVFDVTQDGAINLLDQVINRLVGEPFDIDTSHGNVYRFNRGSMRFGEQDEDVWMAVCELMVGRGVVRTTA